MTIIEFKNFVKKKKHRVQKSQIKFRHKTFECHWHTWNWEELQLMYWNYDRLFARNLMIFLVHWINMELDQRNKNVNNIQMKEIKFNCGKMLFGDIPFWKRSLYPTLCFFGTERRFQKRAVFAMTIGCLGMLLGFRLGTSWVSEEAVGDDRPRPTEWCCLHFFLQNGGAYHSSSFWVVVLDKDDGMDNPYFFS